MEKLLSYLNSLDSESRVLFAQNCKTTVGSIRKYISTRQELNPVTCALIEKFSNKAVTRQDLRSDWDVVWPELAFSKDSTGANP